MFVPITHAHTHVVRCTLRVPRLFVYQICRTISAIFHSADRLSLCFLVLSSEFANLPLLAFSLLSFCLLLLLSASYAAIRERRKGDAGATANNRRAQRGDTN